MNDEGAAIRAATSGCYDAHRAAALSGVPRTTVYWWARQRIVVPSVSPVQEKLWSYADLMSLRIVQWLRKPKSDDGQEFLPASPMPKVRLALARLSAEGLSLWEQDRPSAILVDQKGAIFLRLDERVIDLDGQEVFPELRMFDVTAPFEDEGKSGPDLLNPRPHLRIVPNRMVGEPHLADTRITTETVFALSNRGYEPDRIALMYDVELQPVLEAIDLEQQLSAAA